MRQLLTIAAALLLFCAATNAQERGSVAVDPVLYKITVLGKTLMAKRFLLTSNPQDIAGYVACIGDAIAPTELNGAPASLGVGICPSPLTKKVSFTHWPIPVGARGGAKTQTLEMERDAVRTYVKDCESRACGDIWPNP